MTKSIERKIDLISGDTLKKAGGLYPTSSTKQKPYGKASTTTKTIQDKSKIVKDMHLRLKNYYPVLLKKVIKLLCKHLFRNKNTKRMKLIKESPIPNPQSPIPKSPIPKSPIPNPHLIYL